MARERFTRRQFLIKTGIGGTGLVLAPSLLAACSDDEPSGSTGATGATSAQPTDVRFRTNWIPSVDFVGWYVGDDKGYFDQQGTSIEILAAGYNSPESNQVLAAGKADVGLSTDLLTVSDSPTRKAPTS